MILQGIPVKTDSSVDLGWALLKIYLTCDLLKPVQSDSAGICLFLIPVQSDSAGIGLFLIPVQSDPTGDPC